MPGSYREQWDDVIDSAKLLGRFLTDPNEISQVAADAAPMVLPIGASLLTGGASLPVAIGADVLSGIAGVGLKKLHEDEPILPAVAEEGAASYALSALPLAIGGSVRAVGGPVLNAAEQYLSDPVKEILLGKMAKGEIPDTAIDTTLSLKPERGFNQDISPLPNVHGSPNQDITVPRAGVRPGFALVRGGYSTESRIPGVGYAVQAEGDSILDWSDKDAAAEYLRGLAEEGGMGQSFDRMNETLDLIPEGATSSKWATTAGLTGGNRNIRDVFTDRAAELNDRIARFAETGDFADAPAPDELIAWGVGVEEIPTMSQVKKQYKGSAKKKKGALYSHWVEAKNPYDLDAPIDSEELFEEKAMPLYEAAARVAGLDGFEAEQFLLNVPTPEAGWDVLDSLRLSQESGGTGIIKDIMNQRMPAYTEAVAKRAPKLSPEEVEDIRDVLLFTDKSTKQLLKDDDAIMEALSYVVGEDGIATISKQAIERLKGALKKAPDFSIHDIDSSVVPTSGNVLRDIMEEAGYDSVVHIGGINFDSQAPHRVTVAFRPETQIGSAAPKDSPYLSALAGGFTAAAAGRMSTQEEN